MTAQLAGLAPCTHCGFCLQSCPTFLVTGDEADGPRGRIELMREFTAGRIPADANGLRYHLDRCLGCRACETACPSGVEYGSALEEVRATLNADSLPITSRIVNYVMQDGGMQRVTFAGARVARAVARHLAGPSSLGFAWGMLDATHATTNKHAAHTTASVQEPRVRVALFTGCIMSGLFSHVHEATARVLRANGVQLMAVPGQRCCGALHAHSGQHADAVTLARANVAAFAQIPEDVYVVANSAGCGALLKEYPRLLSGDPVEEDAMALAERTCDVSEILVELGPTVGGPIPLRMAYDPPCHLQHAQRVTDPPLRILESIPELELVPHADAHLCCGSAGSYSLVEPELSRSILDRKVSTLAAANVDVITTGNPGCIMQIGAGLRAVGDDTPVVHPVELLDRSYAAAGYYGSQRSSTP